MQTPTPILFTEVSGLETLTPQVLLPILLNNFAVDPIFKIVCWNNWGDRQVAASELRQFIRWALEISYCDHYPQPIRLQLLDLAWSAQKLLWIF